jgi:isoleucyl-tRNA synthetase
MDIDGQREKMLEKNENITWFPSHVKHGRFEKTVQQAPDWNISRDRFWATAMPVWKSKSGKTYVVGSYAELKELSGVELEDYHRPWIDDVTFEIDGEKYTRIDKVMDSWFEAGSMPFAQFHYPFENKEKFEANFPGDFIVEYIGQVRAWFYYMHAMAVALFGENSFKNVIVTGNVAGNDGRKMSKSYGNYTDPNELMDKFSADSLRFLLLSSPLLNGEDFALQDKEVGDVARKLGMIWNMYDFFTMYAEVDGWEYDGKLEDPSADCTNPLDIWIVSRLHQLVAEVETHMDGYDIPNALEPILPFLDDASNWYVRRSRRRFWKSEDDGDKQMAYQTLHYVLVRLAYLLAPFTPFLAEELYYNLTGDEESIHLKDWLPAGHVNKLVMDDMETVREYINQGLSLRAKAGLKVRQPLASVTVPSVGEHVEFGPILRDELNVKEVKRRRTHECN